MADDLICLQVGAGKKWHAPMSGNRFKTACGHPVSMETPQRFLSLIDSTDRCRHQLCIDARNRAAGR